MEFSEKLKLLMEITNTTNKALATRLIVDPSMISQLRTGARHMAKKNEHLAKMAFYFAEKCQTPSRRQALYDILPVEELKGECDIAKLNDLIYTFLGGDSTGAAESAPPPEIDDIFKSNPRIHTSELTSRPFSDPHLVFCHDTNEKKYYMKQLFEYFMTLKSPDIIYFSSEEIVDWIYNDPDFYNSFRSWCITLTEHGYSFVRIMKPMENKEHFLKNILLWLPMYMTGHVHLYYYPHFRDDIFRQSIITLDNAASYFSSGLARTGKVYYSFFTTDPELSAAYVKQIKDYLNYCRPSFSVCRTEESIAEAFSNIMSLTGDRITKAYHLSPETIPFADVIEYLEHSKNPDYLEAARTVRRLYTTSDTQPGDNIIIDMCSLASASDVKRGKVKLQLPGYVNHNQFHYDVKLYCMHLRNIIHLLETNPRYYFYTLDPADFGEYKDDYYPISIVDNQAMLLVSDDSILNFTQPEIIHTLYEHLYNQSRVHAKHSKGRDKTIETIRNLIAELEE